MEILKALEDAFGLKNVIGLTGRATSLIRRFELSELKFRQAQKELFVSSTMPRFFIEGFVVFAATTAIYFYFSTAGNDKLEVLTAGTFIIFAVFKLLPQFNSIFVSLSTLKGVREVMQNLNELLELKNISYSDPKVKIGPITEGTQISIQTNLKNSHVKTSVENFKFDFRLGEKIVICGDSGIGKTTFLKHICGLANDRNTSLRIHDQTFRIRDVSDKLFFFTEQKPYILNSSVKENIMLSNIFEINAMEDKLNNALEVTGIGSNIDEKRLDGDYRIGSERTSFSGGQLQRIAIARGIFSERPILLFDESSNSLEHDTETSIVKKILNLNKTVFTFLIHSLCRISSQEELQSRTLK